MNTPPAKHEEKEITRRHLVTRVKEGVVVEVVEVVMEVVEVDLRWWWCRSLQEVAMTIT